MGSPAIPAPVDGLFWIGAEGRCGTGTLVLPASAFAYQTDAGVNLDGETHAENTVVSGKVSVNTLGNKAWVMFAEACDPYQMSWELFTEGEQPVWTLWAQDSAGAYHPMYRSPGTTNYHWPDSNPPSSHVLRIMRSHAGIVPEGLLKTHATMKAMVFRWAAPSDLPAGTEVRTMMRGTSKPSSSGHVTASAPRDHAAEQRDAGQGRRGWRCAAFQDPRKPRRHHRVRWPDAARGLHPRPARERAFEARAAAPLPDSGAVRRSERADEGACGRPARTRGPRPRPQ
jgi:hypothetical protein